ncbi:hypothetical protein [Xanthomarina sp. F2636L]|uniref:hypothetical protein n=1 Tax=Xanthomarina sp. F2636L TaxID=2996018 RepID=UPI00225DE29D|nr:hypothetical protein [Xanthomarina sp. F2636L]MCX7550052.1 hypothetical protein [Xanthomarina sp. F2636L]
MKTSIKKINNIAMSKNLLKLTIIVLCLTLFNCQDESASFNNYKYADQENILVCDNLDTKLYFEALLSFEDDITDKYDPKNKNIRRGYSFFTRDAINGKVNFQEIVSPHTMEIFEALKNDKDLWQTDNSINYQSDLLNCLSKNFKNKDLQATYNALVSTNSMRADIFGAPLIKLVKNAHEDRYMAAYVAFDLYYANLFNVDPALVSEKPKNNNANKNNNGLPNAVNLIDAKK